MNISAFRASICLILISCFSLSGCGVAIVAASGAVEATNKTSMDSALTTVKLKHPVAGDVFIEDMKAIAKEKGYQVMNVFARGTTEWDVILVKDTTGWGAMLLDRSSHSSVTLSLQGDGRSVQIQASTYNRGGEADADAAKKVNDDFKSSITAFYARTS